MHALSQGTEKTEKMEAPIEPGSETISEQSLSRHQLIAICINALRLGVGARVTLSPSRPSGDALHVRPGIVHDRRLGICASDEDPRHISLLLTNHYTFRAIANH
jgi:hypothetical protein